MIFSDMHVQYTGLEGRRVLQMRKHSRESC